MGLNLIDKMLETISCTIKFDFVFSLYIVFKRNKQGESLITLNRLEIGNCGRKLQDWKEMVGKGN